MKAEQQKMVVKRQENEAKILDVSKARQAEEAAERKKAAQAWFEQFWEAQAANATAKAEEAKAAKKKAEEEAASKKAKEEAAARSFCECLSMTSAENLAPRIKLLSIEGHCLHQFACSKLHTY